MKSLSYLNRMDPDVLKKWDMFENIADFIHDGNTWKNLLCTCKTLNKIQPKKMLELSNPLWSLIKKYPMWPWKMHGVSGSIWTTCNLVLQNLGMNFHWDVLCKRLTLTKQFMDTLYSYKDSSNTHQKVAHEFMFSNVEVICTNPTLPFDFVLEHHEITWDWRSMTISIDVRTILKHFRLPWYWTVLGANPTVTPSIVDALSIQWSFDVLSANINLTEEFYESHLQEEWDIEWLGTNPCVTAKFIEMNPRFEWNFRKLSNADKALEMYEKFPNKKWALECLSHHPNITANFLKKHPNKKWNIQIVSQFVRSDGSLLEDIDSTNVDWYYVLLLCNENFVKSEHIAFAKRFEVMQNGIVAYTPKLDQNDLAALRMADNIPFYTNVLTTVTILQKHLPFWLLEVMGISTMDVFAISYNDNLDWTHITADMMNMEGLSNNLFKSSGSVNRYQIKPVHVADIDPSDLQEFNRYLQSYEWKHQQHIHRPFENILRYMPHYMNQQLAGHESDESESDGDDEFEDEDHPQ